MLPAERCPSTLLPEVTVHHLLCHASGIADYCEEDEDSRSTSRTTARYRVPVLGGTDGGAHSTTHDLDRFLHA